MKPAQRLGTGLALASLLALAACSKSEPSTPSAPASTAPAAAPAQTATTPSPTTAAPATTPASTQTAPAATTPAATVSTAKETLAATAAATKAAAIASLTNLKLPDLQTASTAQLSTLASQTLTQWTQTLEAPAPAVATEVEATKTALANSQPTAALSSLAKLGDYAKSIPGAEALLESSKQLVSAWALKQGFDSAKISGALGALQKGDYAALATQAAALFAGSGVSTEQQGILDGVLGAFGLDATQASGAINAVKGLFGK